MTTSETIAQVIREISGDMAKHINEAATGEEQDVATDVVSSLRTLAKLVATMDYQEAREVVLDFENPERDRIVEALAARGIFL